MKWVKVEPGCEMPDAWESVIAIDEFGDWMAAQINDTKDRWYTPQGDGFVATHWARVELPA